MTNSFLIQIYCNLKHYFDLLKYFNFLSKENFITTVCILLQLTTGAGIYRWCYGFKNTASRIDETLPRGLKVEAALSASTGRLFIVVTFALYNVQETVEALMENVPRRLTAENCFTIFGSV